MVVFALISTFRDTYVFKFNAFFTSTETIRTSRDGEPRTATSTFTQLLSSAVYFFFFFKSVLLYVHREHKFCYGRGPQDGHLDFHKTPELGTCVLGWIPLFHVPYFWRSYNVS